MPHTYTNCLIHCVFSTKERLPQITKDIKERLWQFIGGIARTNGFRAIEVGGHDDHAHSLIALPSTITIARAVQLIKGGSSKFVHETFRRSFEWQEGYGAFSIGASARDATITSAVKSNITACVHSKRSTSPFWRRTESSMTRGMYSIEACINRPYGTRIWSGTNTQDLKSWASVNRP